MLFKNIFGRNSSLFVLLTLCLALSLAPARALEAAQTLSLDVKRDFGAKGDGVTDDTLAFQKLTRDVNQRGGGVTITIPPGTYRVGGQVENGRNPDGNTYRYDGLDVMVFVDCPKPITIEGQGAKLRLPDGLKFGSFNADGSVLNPPLPFYDTRHAAITGYMAGAAGCADVTLHGLELDGNNTTYILGGGWGDKDRQCRSYGFYFDRCRKVLLENVAAHHFGLDGVYIKHGGLKEGAAPTPHEIRDSRFEYNARQGLSWSGGIGLRAVNCAFRHTGYAVNKQSDATFANAPSAGVDIEAEESICRNGEFINCAFEHTKGPAMYMETGDNADVTFRRCTFWNFEYYSIIPHDPRIVFEDCAIHGSAISAYTSTERPQDATKFYRCLFEDKPHPTYGKSFVDAYGSLLAFDGLTAGLLFQDCRFVANGVKGPFIRNPVAGQTSGFTIDGGSLLLRFYSGYAGESIATLQGGRVRNFGIAEEFTGQVPPGLHVWTANSTLVGDGLEVAGPRILWRASNGETGRIAPSR